MTFLKKIIPLTIILSLALSGFASAYIGNLRTHKFHTDNYRYVYQMNDSNKIYFNSRDEAIDSGYIPCKVCRP